MRQTLIAAAMAMAYQFGRLQNKHNLEDKLLMDAQKIQTEMAQYVIPAVEMVEVAETMAMTRPADVAHAVYCAVGLWMASVARDSHEMPEPAVVYEQLRQQIAHRYSDLLTRSQVEQLQTKLESMGVQADE